MQSATSFHAVSGYANRVPLIGENFAKQFTNTNFVIYNKNVCHLKNLSLRIKKSG